MYVRTSRIGSPNSPATFSNGELPDVQLFGGMMHLMMQKYTIFQKGFTKFVTFCDTFSKVSA
jgi:hypothetical protein